MIKFKIILVLILILLQYFLFLGKHGLYDLMYIKNEILLQKNHNIKLKERNNKLFAEIYNFKSSNDEIIDELSRIELSMIKNHEIFFYY